MPYIADEKRYETMKYNRCGGSGLRLPAISLGFWHNFGVKNTLENSTRTMRRAFDLGITHFDLANNYGPHAGAAEETFGNVFARDFRPYRDELIVSTKAGYTMWPGPYGDWGSKKYLVASLDQSLARMGLEYVDIFYHHRPDPDTDIEETAFALDLLVRQGKALYVGVSNYSAAQTEEIAKIFRSLKTPFVIHQPRYNMLDRRPESGLLDVLQRYKVGCIAYSPLEQGILAGRYLNGIPEDSRVARHTPFLSERNVAETAETVQKLNEIAKRRGQTLAQMSLSWLLKDDRVTSVLVGASCAEQLDDDVKALNLLDFSKEELSAIDAAIQQKK